MNIKMDIMMKILILLVLRHEWHYWPRFKETFLKGENNNHLCVQSTHYHAGGNLLRQQW